MRWRMCLTLLVLGGSASATQAPFTVGVVANSVASIGPSATLQRIYGNNTQWSALLSGIASGGQNWLRVANQLKRVADGGASEQLSLAVGEALEHRPANVLAIAVPEFSISDACGGPDVDDPRFDSYELSMAAINRRQRMVHALRDDSLKSLRDRCISELESAKSGIAHFYGRDT
jgi:hypothetical protein